RGHTVATHTWSHQNLATVRPLKARAEFELGVSAVQLAMGKPVAPFFRFPYLRDTPAMLTHLKERKFAAFSIDIDSKDYRSRDPAGIVRKIMTDLAQQRRGILLFHDIQPATARALPGLLSELKANAYRVVHLVAQEPASTLAEFDRLSAQERDRRRKAL